MSQTNQNDWPKETQKKCPIKVNQSSHKGMTQWLSLFPQVCPVPSHMYYTRFLLINTYFTAFHLCGNFFLQSWSARALVTYNWSGAQDLVLHHCDPAQSLAGKPSPVLSHCTLRPRELCTKGGGSDWLTIMQNIYICIPVMEIFSFNFAVGVCLSTLIKFYTLK